MSKFNKDNVNVGDVITVTSLNGEFVVVSVHDNDITAHKSDVVFSKYHFYYDQIKSLVRTYTPNPDPLIILLDKDKELALKELSKDGHEKPDFSLIPQLAISEVARVMMYGAKKYDAYNFSKGEYNTVYCAAALRHINKYLLNQDIDDESGLYHLAHAVSNLMMLLDNDLSGTSIDNRNKAYSIPNISTSSGPINNAKHGQ
jgi:hypothetical protein